jgi:hypothetical protein
MLQRKFQMNSLFLMRPFLIPTTNLCSLNSNLIRLLLMLRISLTLQASSFAQGIPCCLFAYLRRMERLYNERSVEWANFSLRYYTLLLKDITHDYLCPRDNFYSHKQDGQELCLEEAKDYSPFIFWQEKKRLNKLRSSLS